VSWCFLHRYRQVDYVIVKKSFSQREQSPTVEIVHSTKAMKCIKRLSADDTKSPVYETSMAGLEKTRFFKRKNLVF